MLPMPLRGRLSCIVLSFVVADSAQRARAGQQASCARGAHTNFKGNLHLFEFCKKSKFPVIINSTIRPINLIFRKVLQNIFTTFGKFRKSNTILCKFRIYFERRSRGVFQFLRMHIKHGSVPS